MWTTEQIEKLMWWKSPIEKSELWNFQKKLIDQRTEINQLRLNFMIFAPRIKSRALKTYQKNAPPLLKTP